MLFGHIRDVFDRFAYVVDTIDTARTIIVLLGLGLISTFTIWLAPASNDDEQEAASVGAGVSNAQAEAEAQRAMAKDTYNRSMAEEGWGYSEEGASETPGTFGQSNDR